MEKSGDDSPVWCVINPSGSSPALCAMGRSSGSGRGIQWGAFTSPSENQLVQSAPLQKMSETMGSSAAS